MNVGSFDRFTVAFHFRSTSFAQVAAPLTGDADRTVEAWVFNPDIPGEETIVAWGRRGGGDGTNWSMNYGNHNTWGALGGWGGSADMAFVAGQTGGPEAVSYTHLRAHET